MSLYCYYCNYNFSSDSYFHKCIGCGNVIETPRCSCWKYDKSELSWNKDNDGIERMEKYRILGMEFYRYQYSVMELCEQVHSYSVGTMDCYEALTPYVAFAYLVKRVSKWHVCRSNFDEIVLKLVKETIREYELSDYVPREKDAKTYLKKHPSTRVYIKDRVEPEEIQRMQRRRK